MNLKKSLFTASLALTAIANAQEAPKFSLTGEFRPRTELFGNGQGNGAAEGSTGYVQTSVRAAINAKYTTDSYTTYIGIQEVFNFGDRPQISPLASSTAFRGNTGSTIRIQEAWADIKLGEYSSLKVGRQPLSYDDQRILGGLGWAQQARTHDAAVLKFKKDGYSLDLGGALNTYGSSVYNTADLFSYRDMGFLRVNKKYDALNLTFLGLVNTFQNGGSNELIADNNTTDNKSTLITAGLHADYTTGGLKLSANAFLQNGKRINDAVVEGAYLASLDASYKAADKLTILAGGEIISGQTEDSAAFFPLYGTNHKFNGLIDRFYVGNHPNHEGLIDLNLGVKTKIAGAAVTAKFHNFSGASDLADGSGRDELGNELDLVVAKKFKGFKVVGGYSQFFNPESSNLQDNQNWAWLMLIIKPKFL